ncbi:MAG: MBL fold metallo-hydrolase [Candidatus Aenigmarchaeota archaeon]|nr:MBL fold metallo-hydrolase [Candidatus Aenigmarchaeota archaeon]
MDVTVLGAGREVGRSAILVNTGAEKFLLDYGIEVQNMNTPLAPPLDLAATFPSHAHLDHCGLVPMLRRNGHAGDVFATPATLDIMDLMLRDSIKVQEKRGVEPYFASKDIDRSLSQAVRCRFGKSIQFKNTAVSVHNAGHVPGSASILLDTGRKRMVYTGDIKFSETELMEPAYSNFKDIDAVITESTYWYRNHPDRKALEKWLVDVVKSTHDNNGFSVLPCFAVGRTQEMLLIVSRLGIPVYLDGMGRDVTRIILQHPDSVRNTKRLKQAFSAARKITSPNHRKKALQEPGIIITTAGMLNGGPVHYYIKKLHDRENSSLILTGYQVENTVGRMLMETGKYVTEELSVKPRMGVTFMDFSAHCSRDELLEFFRKTSPEKIILVHSPTTHEFAEELKNMGFQAYAPANGDAVSIG